MRLPVIAAIALAASVAHANDHVRLGYPGVTDKAPVPDDRLRFELAGAVTGGSFEAGPLHGGGPGVLIAGGIRYDRLAVLAELGFVAIFEPARTSTLGRPIQPPPLPSDGGMRRVAIEARWSLLAARSLAGPKRGPPDAVVRDDLWIEAGVGREHVAWNLGPDLDRPDVAFGIGVTASGRSQPGQPSGHAGVDLAIRVIFGRDPSDPSAIDHSIIGSMGFAFGN